MPAPLFIIAPGRSFTSVIGGMIGQHPQIYGLPEVNLSHVDSAGQLLSVLAGPFEFGLAGLLRLLAQLHAGEQSEEAVLAARRWLSEHRHWKVEELWAHIQDEVGDRILLEKSPLNTMRLEYLQRLLRVFPDANFLHLTRHPGTAGKSSMALRQSLREGRGLGMEEPMKVRELDPEKGWLRSQTNIMEFWEELAAGQYLRIKAELLLSDPGFYLAQICEWLGIRQDDAALEAMMHPEASPYACLGPPSARYGNDPNWLQNPVLDLERLKRISEPPLDAGAEWRGGEAFSKPVLKFARQFGYG